MFLKRKIIIYPLIIIGGLFAFWQFYLSNPSFRLNTPIRPGLVTLKFQGNEIDAALSSKAETTGVMGIQACTFVKIGCADYLNKGFSEEELGALSAFERDCVENGCLLWGMPAETEEQRVRFSNEEATSFVNTYRPSWLPFKDIRFEFKNNEVTVQAESNFPGLNGIATARATKSSSATFEILDVSIGRIPIPADFRKKLEQQFNSFFNSYPSTYYVQVKSIDFSDGFVDIVYTAPKGLEVTIKE